MMAMYRKELCENLRWAGLLFLLLIVWFGYAIHRNDDNFLGVMDPSVWQASAVGCAIGGAALGFLQILQDRRRGRWDFVFHRPLSPRKMFAAKLLAGITLYALATGLALTAAIAYLAAPGSLAIPFDPATILPRLADLLLGIVWYLAAVLAASRQARWIGSRLFPLGLAFIVEFGVLITSLNFAIAAAWIAAGCAIFLIAAWAIFSSMGDSQRQPLVVRLLTGIAVGSGVWILVFLAGGVFQAVADLAERGSVELPYRYYMILKTGQVVIITLMNGSMQSVSTIDGAPIPGLDRDTISKQSPLDSSFLDLDDAPPPLADRVNQSGLFAYHRYFLGMGLADACVWTWSENRKLILGYNTGTRLLVAQVGKDGFHTAAEHAEPFDQSLLLPTQFRNDQYAFPVPRTMPIFDASNVWKFDPIHQRLQLLLLTGAGEKLLDANVLSGRGESSADVPAAIPAIIAASARTFYLQGNDGSHFSVPLPPHESRNDLIVDVLQNNRYSLMLQPYDRYLPDQLLIIDGAGRILSSQTLPPLPMINYPDPLLPRVIVGSVSPPISTPLAFVIDHFYPPQQVGPVDWICAAVVAILTPFWTFWLLRRRSVGRAAAVYWLFLTVIGGVIAPLLLICTRSRAVRLACPACRKPRLITRELCEHCGQPFTPPAMQGIEIFVAASADEADAAGLAAV